MSTKSTDPSTQSVLAHLEQNLAAAEEKEQTALLQVEEAKCALSAARDERKRLRKTIEVFSGTRSPSLTKKNVRPYVLKLLADGPLPEKEITSRLEQALREEGRSLTGLSLVVRPLRSEFSTDDGLWTLENPHPLSQKKNQESISTSKEKGGAA